MPLCCCCCNARAKFQIPVKNTICQVYQMTAHAHNCQLTSYIPIVLVVSNTNSRAITSRRRIAIFIVATVTQSRDRFLFSCHFHHSCIILTFVTRSVTAHTRSRYIIIALLTSQSRYIVIAIVTVLCQFSPTLAALAYASAVASAVAVVSNNQSYLPLCLTKHAPYPSYQAQLQVSSHQPKPFSSSSHTHLPHFLPIALPLHPQCAPPPPQP